jgi:MFS transporter, APGE family, 1-arseno-3-phosphoglycerate exporter
VQRDQRRYLILAYTDSDKVALNVGFYYMANAVGRLLGTLLSGLMYLIGGLPACLWTATLLVLAATLLTLRLPTADPAPTSAPDLVKT